MGSVCGLLGKTRQAFYKQKNIDYQSGMEKAIVLEKVKEIRTSQQRLGSKKLYEMLSYTFKQHKIKLGRDRFINLLAEHGMLVRKRKRKYARTTDSNHPFKKYPNLVKDLIIIQPNRLWVSDITYLSLVSGGFCYLSLITDAYSRKIVGYCLYPSLKREGPIQALKMALASLDGGKTYFLIHHSDRGIQYCSKEYTDLLSGNNVKISMAEKGNPYENAIAERVNGILKSEFGLGRMFKNYEIAAAVVKESIRIYNQERLHGSCDNLTPDQAHTKQGELVARWRKKGKSKSTEPGLTGDAVNPVQDLNSKK